MLLLSLYDGASHLENRHSEISRCLLESERRRRSDFIDMHVPSRRNVFHKLNGSSCRTVDKNPARGETADRRTKILKDALLNSSPGGESDGRRSGALPFFLNDFSPQKN